MLIGARPGPPTFYLGGPGGGFLGSKIRVIFGCVFEASPSGTEGFGHEILGQHHQHNWAFVSHFWPIFGHLNISRVLKGS